MHELSITQTMLELVLEQARQNGSKKVQRINLVIGEMSGVVDDCVRFYFDFLSKGTTAEEAQLSFKRVTPKARCRECGKQFKLNGLDWTCPCCRTTRIDIVEGKELFLESIEVDNGDKGT